MLLYFFCVQDKKSDDFFFTQLGIAAAAINKHFLKNLPFFYHNDSEMIPRVDMYCMYLWGVVVLELDSHPDHKKGQDRAHCACPKTNPIDPSHTT